LNLETFPSTSLFLYPERRAADESWFDRKFSVLFKRLTSRLSGALPGFAGIVERVASYDTHFASLDEAALSKCHCRVRDGLRRNGFNDDLIAESFALVREVARRTIGLAHYDVQIYGGWVLLNGMVAEMETGEGKTLTATLAACTAAFAGIPVHIVTVNDYLAERDAKNMEPIFQWFGLQVRAVVQEMDISAKKEAYRADITYCTNKTLAFDFLRDRLTFGIKPSQLQLQLERLYGGSSRLDSLLLPGLHYAIVDEADSVLIDEARTPLIISGPGSNSDEQQEVFADLLKIAAALSEPDEYTLEQRERRVDLTDEGREEVNRLATKLGVQWIGRHRCEELVIQALTALYLFRLDQDYLVKDGKVQIIDEYTGRLMADRSWERGLHQFIELKEECEMTATHDTLARMSYQSFFRRYMLLAGMTGTASEVAGELAEVYDLRVVKVPTNCPSRRVYLPATILPDIESKWQAVFASVLQKHKLGRPVLVGTRSVAASERISSLFSEAGMEHEVLNARQDEDEARIISEAGQRAKITIATNMAGRGTDIVLAPGVHELGGLHVICTEFHDAGRIDRQLFGRCGRQGNNGSCEMIASLEDDLLKDFGGPIVGRLLAQARAQRFIPARLREQAMKQSQKRAEAKHAAIRRDLLAMDKEKEESLAFAGQVG
jgi:preprotein translocase subunit SecA